jgi:hypothetical protein
MFWYISSHFVQVRTQNTSTNILHMPIVVNAVSTRVLLQFFFPQSAPCPIFFPPLTFFRCVLGPCHTCLLGAI